MRAVPSLRVRLTLTILVLTGLVAVVAVLAGMRILRSNVVGAAVADSTPFVGDIEVISEEPFDDIVVEGEDLVFDEAFPVDEAMNASGVEATLSETFELDAGQASDFELQYLAELVEELALQPALVDEFATANGEVFVELSTGAIVSFPAGEVQAIVAPTDTIVLGQSIYASERNIFDFDDESQGDRQFEFASVASEGRTVGIVIDVTDELRALDEIGDALWISAGVVTLLAGAAAWVLVGRALRPVEAITARVNQITSGNLGDRVPEPKRQDEIGLLAATMNSMLGRLDLDDRRRREFISDASHELRTPVAVLRNEAEVARRAPTSTTLADLSGVVIAETQRLGSMVEDLLSLARADEGSARLPDSTEPHRITDVDEVLRAETQRSRGVRVDRSRISGGRVSARPSDVARCLAHLLDNAARHAHDVVAVGVETTDATVSCWIDDDGPGVSPDDRQRIFGRFVRLDDARTRDAGGSGLGLAVVRELVDSMGATIDVSEAPIGGARFCIRWTAA